jgi:hypothetical protein
MVMSMTGRLEILSAESSAFSTSSRMVVYKHLPGCTGRDGNQAEEAVVSAEAF